MSCVVRTLRPEDDRSGFSCGDIDLDRFFRRFAGQNQFRHFIGTTYVAVADTGAIAGFVTVAVSSMQIDGLDNAALKKLPNYPLPVLRMARLGVDTRFQNQGAGKTLLKAMIALACDIRDKGGCIGVVVDAKAGAVDFYRRYGFEPLPLLEGALCDRPAPQTLFLPMTTILQAKEANDTP